MHLALIHPLKFVFSNDACLFSCTHTLSIPLAPGESSIIHIDLNTFATLPGVLKRRPITMANCSAAAQLNDTSHSNQKQLLQLSLA